MRNEYKNLLNETPEVENKQEMPLDEFMKPEPQVKEETVLKPKKAKIVNCINVNIRKTPSKTSEIIKTLKEGTQVLLLSEEGSSCKVQVGSVIGCLPKKFVVII